LSDLHQLNAKILHGLQCTMKLCLVTEDAHQDGAICCLLDVQIQSGHCGHEGIRQFSAYADLIGKALSATSHDCAAATSNIAATKTVMPIVHGFSGLEFHRDMPPPHVHTQLDGRIQGTVLWIGRVGITL
jgi:hypothetical protein